MLGPWISVGSWKGDSAPKDSYASAALAKAAMLMPVSMDLYSVFKDRGQHVSLDYISLHCSLCMLVVGTCLC